MTRVRVADVALDPRSGGSDALYTYLASDRTSLGDAVIVPLGKRSEFGFVVAEYEATAEDLGFPLESLKPIRSTIEGISLPVGVIELSRFVAEECLCPLPVTLSAATPPGIRDRLVAGWKIIQGAPAVQVTPMQAEVLRTLRETGGEILESRSKKLDPGISRALRSLRAKGLVEQVTRLVPPPERAKSQALLRLCGDAAKIESFLARDGKRRPAQALTIMRLQLTESAALTAGEIKSLAGVTDATLKALLEAGLLEMDGESPRTDARAPEPNADQRLAIDAIAYASQSGEHASFLLFGVTGSGKTEVYLRAASEALRAGRQVLYLVPEIALAAQAISQLRERFGKTVAVLHSNLSATERLQNWLKIRSGQASVILGARSALFAPLENIGLIVLDEEHEGAYKQESAPRYHAKRLAMFLGRMHRCPVVLGSATPSVESFHEAESGEDGRGLTLVSLPSRAASASLPTVVIRDLTEGYKLGRPGILSPDLQDEVWKTLDRGEQVILFLNRRAYAPFIICRDCGHQFMCPNCSVSLSFHRRDGRLRCHHCGYSERPADSCPKCGGVRLNPFGVGTEKVEEAVQTLFPDARVARLDRDIARRKGALEQILAEFRSGDIRVLVGTQMVAKGLDFPNVTLVGVIAADVSLNIPDFRSSERTFQLLSQVAGRAGRGASPGKVIIQTFNPDHVAVRAAQSHDYLRFYETLKTERLEAGYPPFSRLVNIVLSGEDRSQVAAASAEVAAKLRTAAEFAVLGPSDCVVERLQSKWRRHVLVKLPANSPASRVGDLLLGYEPKGVHIVIDVDPYSLM